LQLNLNEKQPLQLNQSSQPNEEEFLQFSQDEEQSNRDEEFNLDEEQPLELSQPNEEKPSQPNPNKTGMSFQKIIKNIKNYVVKKPKQTGLQLAFVSIFIYFLINLRS